MIKWLRYNWPLFRRLYWRWRIIRHHGDELNRRVTVEQYLLACYEGKKPLPNKDKCKELAFKLGIPDEQQG